MNVSTVLKENLSENLGWLPRMLPTDGKRGILWRVTKVILLMVIIVSDSSLF